MTSSAWLLTLALASAPIEAQTGLTEPGRDPKRIDSSVRYLFGMQWYTPTVATGFYRTVGETLGTPGIDEKRAVLLVGTGDGWLRGHRLGTGKLLWTRDIGLPFLGPITVLERGDRLAVTAAADGSLFAFEPGGGEVRWRTQLDGQSLAPVSEAGRFIVATTVDNKVVALDRQSGEIVWSKGRAKPSNLTIRGHGRPLVVNGVVYAAFSDGYAEAFELKTGNRLWSRPVSLEKGEFVDADADPQLVDGILYLASYNGGVVAMRPESGKNVWSRPARSVTSLTHYGDIVIAGSADGWVWGFDRKTGATRYRVRVPAGNTSRMLVSRNHVVFSNGESGLIVLDARSGEPLQATSLHGRAAGAVALRDDFLAVMSSRGYVYALRRGAPGQVDSTSHWSHRP